MRPETTTSNPSVQERRGGTPWGALKDLYRFVKLQIVLWHSDRWTNWYRLRIRAYPELANFMICDFCGAEFDPVKYRFLCPTCGWKANCCDGAPQPSVTPSGTKDENDGRPQ